MQRDGICDRVRERDCWLGLQGARLDYSWSCLSGSHGRPGPVHSVCSGTRIRIPARGVRFWRLRHQPKPRGARKLIPQGGPVHLLFILDFVSLSGFLFLSACVSPPLKLKRPVRKIVNRLESCQFQRTFLLLTPSSVSVHIHTPSQRPGAARFGAETLRFGLGLTRFGSLPGSFYLGDLA